MKNIIRERIRLVPIALFALLFLLVGGCGNSASAGTISENQQIKETTAQASQKGILEVHFIDVGQGDATF